MTTIQQDPRYFTPDRDGLTWKIDRLSWERNAKRPCLGTRVKLPNSETAEYQWITYERVFQMASELASGLIKLGLQPVRFRRRIVLPLILLTYLLSLVHARFPLNLGVYDWNICLELRRMDCHAHRSAISFDRYCAALRHCRFVQFSSFHLLHTCFCANRSSIPPMKVLNRYNPSFRLRNSPPSSPLHQISPLYVYPIFLMSYSYCYPFYGECAVCTMY